MLIEEYCNQFKTCEFSCPWRYKKIIQGYEFREKCATFKDFEAENKALEILLQSGIELDRVSRLENLENRINNMSPVLSRIREIEKGKPGLTLLISPNGTGKTHILVGLLFQCVLMTPRWVYYITSDKLKWLAGNMAGMNPCEKASEMHNQLQRASVIMIDELYKEGPITATFENYLNPLLDSNKRIYIASNFFLDGNSLYSMKYSTATMSRLRKAVVIKWEGVDYRKLKK